MARVRSFAALATAEVAGGGRARARRSASRATASIPGDLPGRAIDLGVYAGILKRARLVVANDTGPGHIASSVGAPLISVLGPTDATRYRPWGSQVSVLQGSPWPTLEQVSAEALQTQLAM